MEPEDSKLTNKKKKDSWVGKKKRGMASTTVGYAVVENVLDAETKLLIKVCLVFLYSISTHAETVCKMVAAATDKKNAKQIKEDIYTIATKIAILFQDGLITSDQFLPLKITFRKICSALRNGYLTKTLEESTAARIAELIGVFGEGIKTIVSSYLKSGTLEKVDHLIVTLGSASFIMQASKGEGFDALAMVLAHYLQETGTG